MVNPASPGPASSGRESGLYPLMLTPAFLAEHPVLVIGGGKVAERKIQNLLEVGARIKIIAPTLTESLQEQAQAGTIEWEARPWQAGDIPANPTAILILAATDRAEVNREVAAEARQAGRLVNLADDPAQCDFILPGVVRSDEITIAIATGAYTGEAGVSPALTAYLRRHLAELIGPEFSRLARLLRELRPVVKAHIQPARRAALWQKMVNPTILRLLKEGHEREVRTLLENIIQESTASE